MILSGAMLLRHLGELDGRVGGRGGRRPRAPREGAVRTADLGGVSSTDDVARAIAAELPS